MARNLYSCRKSNVLMMFLCYVIKTWAELTKNHFTNILPIFTVIKAEN